MRDAPENLRDETPDPEAAHLNDGALASDRGEGAEIAVAERRNGPAGRARDQETSYLLVLLFGEVP